MRARRFGAVLAGALLVGCSGGSGTPGTTTRAATTTASTTTLVPIIGGAAGLVFASGLTGYSIEDAPAGTTDDLLTTVERIPGSSEVVGSVDVRLVTATADSSTMLVVLIALRPSYASQAATFANAAAGSLATGNPLAVTSVAGLPATYIEGPNPLDTNAKLRAVLVQKGGEVAIVFAVKADRPALETLAAVLVPHLGS